MKFAKNLFWNTSYQLFVLLVPFITIPYINRILGPVGIGINAFTNSIIQYFILFGSLGFSLYGNREIAYHRENKSKLTNTFWEIVILRLITVGVASIAFFVFLQFTTKYKIEFLMQYLSLLAVVFDVSWFFMGLENFKVIVIRNVIVKLISIVAIFTFIKHQSDLPLYILILSLSILLGNMTMIPYLKRYLGKLQFHTLNIFQHLRPSILLFIPQIAINIYIVLNKTMLGQLASVTQAGFFDNSDKIIKILLAVITATGTVMLPHIANSFAKGEMDKIRQSLTNFFEFVTFVSVPLAFGVIALAPTFSVLFFGEKFAAVGQLMQIEALIIPIMAWSNVVGAQYLIPLGKTKDYTIAVSLGAIINVVLNVPLILWLGASGSAIATVCSELGVVAYELWAVSKEINIFQLFSPLWKYLIASLLMFAGIMLFKNSISLSPIISMGFEVVLGIVIYLIALLPLHSGAIILGQRLIGRFISRKK